MPIPLTECFRSRPIRTMHRPGSQPPANEAALPPVARDNVRLGRAMATVAPMPVGRRINSERLFYSGMAAALLAVIFMGFAPSFYLRGVFARPANELALTPLVIGHGLLFSGWILLFATQAALVSAGRVDLHRRLGQLGAVMAVAMVMVGIFAALHGAIRHSGPPPIDPLTWLAVPLFDMPVFAGLIAAGLYNRRTPQTHKRLMLIATIGLIPPAVGRMAGAAELPIPVPLVIIGALALFVTALAAWDWRSRRRVHPVTIIGGAVLVGSWLFRLAIWETGPWMAFAGWAVGLVR